MYLVTFKERCFRMLKRNEIKMIKKIKEKT